MAVEETGQWLEILGLKDSNGYSVVVLCSEGERDLLFFVLSLVSALMSIRGFGVVKCLLGGASSVRTAAFLSCDVFFPRPMAQVATMLVQHLLSRPHIHDFIHGVLPVYVSLISNVPATRPRPEKTTD